MLLPRRIDGDWVLLHRPTSVHDAKCGARRVVLGPGADNEVSGDVPNVVPVRTRGWPENDRLFLHYGAADTRIALALASRSEVLDYLLACPPGSAAERPSA